MHQRNFALAQQRPNASAALIGAFAALGKPTGGQIIASQVRQIAWYRRQGRERTRRARR